MSNNEQNQFRTDLAAVLGCSATTGNIISPAIKQAKEALNITAHTKSLTDDDKAAVINWHKAQLSLASEQQADIETIAPAVGLHIDTTLKPVRLNNVNIEPIETTPAAPDEKDILIAQLQARLAAIDAKHAPTYGFNEQVRLTVKVENNPVQIAIDGFYLNALMTMAGIDKAGCKTWIQAAVDGWGAFDAKMNITKQVRCLIVRELESQLIKARG